MESVPNFFSAGSDGEIDADVNLWCKGVVYTARLPLNEDVCNYSIVVSFKRGTNARPDPARFEEAYRRVMAVATRLPEFVRPDTDVVPESVMVSHGWRDLGAHITAAFASFEVSCVRRAALAIPGKRIPDAAELRSCGGATLEELASLGLVHADLIWNEFDFTGLTSDPGFVTVSYGEPVSSEDGVNFQPLIERAEKLAQWYWRMLDSFGKVRSRTFRIVRREWFPASRTFAAVHICFEG